MDIVQDSEYLFDVEYKRISQTWIIPTCKQTYCSVPSWILYLIAGLDERCLIPGCLKFISFITASRPNLRSSQLLSGAYRGLCFPGVKRPKRAAVYTLSYRPTGICVLISRRTWICAWILCVPDPVKVKSLWPSTKFCQMSVKFLNLMFSKR
jgi:hypothetical protein